VVGARYQWAGFVRSPVARQKRVWFIYLTLLSLALYGLAIWAGLYTVFVLATIGVFMVHGFFNEITLYEKTTHATANPFSIGALCAWLLALLLFGLAHPSFFFTPQLTYLPVFLQPDLFVSWLSQHGQLITLFSVWGGAVCAVAAIGLATWVAVGGKSGLWLRFPHIFFVIFIGLTIWAGWFWYPPTYVFLFTGLLLYHFLIWFWFYLRVFWRTRRSEIRPYLLLHAAVLAPFIIMLFSEIANWYGRLFLLNSYVFVGLTTVHIITSFINERWFERLVLRVTDD
jgi:hypothetical protein